MPTRLPTRPTKIADYPGARVELHTVEDGKMKKVESIAIPAQQKVELMPGSYHVMAFEIEDPKTSGEIKVKAPVKAKSRAGYGRCAERAWA